MAEHRIASLGDVSAGRLVVVDVQGTRVVVIRVGDNVHACADVCSHRGGRLSEGRLMGARLVCPLHGWRFDVRTGQCVLPSHGNSVPVYPVRVDGDDVFVELP